MDKRLSLLLCAAALIAMDCSQPTATAGGGSVIGNPPIAGMLRDQGGHTVPYARVTLYKADYDPGSGDSASARTFSDSGGRFLIQNVPPDAYNILAAVTEGRLMGMAAQVLVPAGTKRTDTVHAPDCILAPPAAVSISLRSLAAAVGDRFYLPGTPASGEIDSSVLRVGVLTLEDVPAGIFPALFQAGSGSGSSVNILSKTVTLIAGQTTVLGPYQAWKQSRRIFINTSATGAETGAMVRAFPLLIRMDSADFDFTLAGDSGQDIRFTEADGSTPLAFHIVRWGPAGTQIWVRVDSIRPNDDAQFLYLFSGMAAAVPEDKDAAVFDTADGFAAVWHMGDDPQGTQPAYLDATGFANHGTGAGMTPASRVEGLSGRGAAFDGKTQSILVADTPGLRLRTVTISAWIKADSLGGRILDKTTGGGGYGFDTFAGHLRLTSGTMSRAGQSPLPIDSFIHVAASFDGLTTRFYLNGNPDGETDSLPAPIPGTSALRIGAAADGSSGFRGIIDEVQISRMARTADWIKLGFETQKPGSHVISIR